MSTLPSKMISDSQSAPGMSAPSFTPPLAASPLNGVADRPTSPNAPSSAPAPTPVDAALARLRPDVAANAPLLNRDLSWLEFNKRVLNLAIDERTPLLERVRFLAIFSSNLDEFCMKRLGMLAQRIKSGQTGPDLDGLEPAALLDSLRANIRDLQQLQAECFEFSIKPALAAQGIELVDSHTLDAANKQWLRAWFRRCVFPVLTPLSVDPGHRFPFISNLSRNLGVLMVEPGATGTVAVEPLFARLKVPNIIQQWVRLPDDPSAPPVQFGPVGGDPRTPGSGRFVALSDVIQANLEDLFPGMQLLEVVGFRVTRDTEAAIAGSDDDADNLLELVEQQLRKRRFGAPVRLEVSASPSPRILANLTHELELSAPDTCDRHGPLDYTTLNEIADLDRPDLKYPRWTPVVPSRLGGAERNKSIFDVIREGELIVHHPFESFEASAQRFIQEAARDPDVIAIKQTIYRTSKDSPFVQSLIRAAESGKQVAVLVELRARFDEQANVRIAQLLEKVGAHVAYGVVGYKTHCKAAMVVRREPDGLRTYAHLGTGNYHPRTAMLYTDLGLFTCEPAIIDDVIELFNFLTGRSRLDTFDTLLVAPLNMKKRIIAMIRREMEQAERHARGESPVGGRIIAKMNALGDNEVAEYLYAASRAGVQITLFVRGFCCIRPGVPGLSENIRVVSVVGRFLEHSRIFHFGAGQLDPLDGEWYISSADWMYRNLNNRVEAATPVISRGARAKLLRILQVMNLDRIRAWEAMPDGSYTRLQPTIQEAAVPDSPAMLGTFDTLMREVR